MNVHLLADFSDIWSNAPVWIIAPIGAVLALIFAVYFSRGVMAHSEGEPEMIRIAEAVRAGAMAYLTRQYRVVAMVFAGLLAVLVLLGLSGIQSLVTPVGVLFACLFSGMTGWFGMKMATNASARTTFAAKNSLNEGLRVAFRAGAVMGLIVVGFALLDVSIWFFLWNSILPTPETGLVGITTIMLSYGMGASTQALFARVGGGIYTKAADVGADLVGKVEAGIPEDDPRNPATIADNVGDNVGDVAGMGADLYESYYGSILATMALGAAAAFGIAGLGTPGTTSVLAMKLAVAPMAIAGIGIICSLLGVFVVRTKEDATFSQLLKSLHTGVWFASGVIAISALGLLWYLFKDMPEVSGLGLWGSIMAGLLAGLVIAVATEYYTSYEHKPTKDVAEQALTGPATVIISGTALGMLSTWVPIATIVIAILTAFTFAGGGENFLLGLYGVGIAAVGMLSTLGITLATDAYGPIADNAGGNAEMSGQPAYVRERTDMLDALGNTTAATGKGFAIGSAALTALALLAAYISVVQTNLNKQLTEGADATALLASTTGQYVAAYQGHGRFVIADRDDNSLSGGMLAASDTTRRRVKSSLEIGQTVSIYDDLDEFTNSYPVSFDGVEFHLVPTDRADIKQVLAFYDVTLMNPRVLGGLFMGVLLAFVFCALTMKAVGRAAYEMMNECRRQFGIMKAAFAKQGMSESDIADPMKWPKQVDVDGKQFPDYAQCVAISTSSAQREMVVPAMLAIIVPVAVGLVLGVGGVMGLLAGGLTSGFAIAIFMANAGGAWDNAKKYIEMGHHGGKGSDAHKAGVVGDTVGDPFKDTSGPSLNILIKLIAIVSVVFAGLIVKFSPAIGALVGLG